MTKKANPLPTSSHAKGQTYDTMFKLLIEDQEREMLPQLWPGVTYLETKDIEVIRSPLRVDRVYIVRYRRRKHVFHPEFETASSKEMKYRLPEYHTYFLAQVQAPSSLYDSLPIPYNCDRITHRREERKRDSDVAQVPHPLSLEIERGRFCPETAFSYVRASARYAGSQRTAVEAGN